MFCTIDKYIVIQRRSSPFDILFNRTWSDYKVGFGDVTGDFWLGLDKLHAITAQPYTRYSLRIEATTSTGAVVYVETGDFSIGDEKQRYKIMSIGRVVMKTTSNLLKKDQVFAAQDKDQKFKCGMRYNGFWYYVRAGTSYNSCRISVVLSCSWACCHVHMISVVLSCSWACCHVHMISVVLSCSWACCHVHMISVVLSCSWACCHVHMISVVLSCSWACCHVYMISVVLLCSWARCHVYMISVVLSCSWACCHVYMISVVLSLFVITGLLLMCHFGFQVSLCKFLYIYYVIWCFQVLLHELCCPCLF